MRATREQAISELLDKQELTELVTKISRGVNRNDDELILSCYHPDARDERGYFSGSPQEFVAWLRRDSHAHRRTYPCHHALTNMLFDVQGDVAFGEIYFITYMMVPGQPVDSSIGRYVDRYERRNGEWKIARRRVILEFGGVDYDNSAFQQGARDKSDPSYER